VKPPPAQIRQRAAAIRPSLVQARRQLDGAGTREFDIGHPVHWRARQVERLGRLDIGDARIRHLHRVQRRSIGPPDAVEQTGHAGYQELDGHG
jgi:hypothetical protein